MAVFQPFSFEGRYGYIRYSLKAKMEIPWKMDQKVKCNVELNTLVDTNEPRYKTTVRTETRKQFQPVFCFFGGGDAQFTCSIPRTCYCAGETILIKARVRNNSMRGTLPVKNGRPKLTKFHLASD